jgi:hypothetical protein
MWALGYAPADEAVLERARRVETELRHIRRALEPVEFGAAAASQHACRCRARIAEYVNEGDGPLARAVNQLPALGGCEMDQALDEGERLLLEAREAMHMLDQIGASSERLRRVAARYSEKIPSLWRAHGGDAFEDQLLQARSTERLREIQECIGEAEQVLADRVARLEDTVRALRRALGEDADGAGSNDGFESSANVEEQIISLVERIDRASREIRSRALRAIDETSERHLIHLGVRDPRDATPAPALGSVQQKLARKRQLAAAPVRER